MIETVKILINGTPYTIYLHYNKDGCDIQVQEEVSDEIYYFICEYLKAEGYIDLDKDDHGNST